MKLPLIPVFLAQLPPRWRTLVQTLVYGLGAGLATVFFQLGINGLYRGVYGPLSRQSLAAFLMGSLVVIMGSALLTGWLLHRFCPEAQGSGIPQLKAAYWKDFGHVPWRVAWVKFVAGILSIGGGSSLGREGPSVQLAGAVGASLAGVLGEPRQKRRLAAAAGAAAGLAAAFNTPIAAVTFVLEEILQDLNNRVLGSVLLASLLGALVVHGIIGKQPAFALQSVEVSDWIVYLLVPLVAVAGALGGVAFQKFTLALRAHRPQSCLAKLPAWTHPALGALVTWELGVMVFMLTGKLGVFSLGYDDLSDGLAGKLTWQVAAVLLVSKFIATVACYSLGGCGGIFSPTLFFGGMIGLVLGGLAGIISHLAPANQIVLAVVGMSACLGAVVRAPVTSILIVFEMTHEFALVPALMLGALVSQAISRRFLPHNFYDSILIQDGHRLEHLILPRDLAGWQQWPVSALASPAPVVARAWDAKALENLLHQHPYSRFPVVMDGKVTGILLREEARQAIAQHRAPALQPATCCGPEDPVRTVQTLLLESPTGMVVVWDPARQEVTGVVTLHDLLRAEMALADHQA